MNPHCACITICSRIPAGIFWQEEIIPFFQNLTLSPDNKDTYSCYLELAEKVCGCLGLGGWLGSARGGTECRRYAHHAGAAGASDELSVLLACPPGVQVRTGLGHLDPYFSKLADGMIAWIACWQQLNP